MLRTQQILPSTLIAFALAAPFARAADFNDDGFDDVAVASRGGPQQQYYLGQVYVFFGAESSGLTAGAVTVLAPADFAIDAGVHSPLFGAALIAADFDGDGFDDLAIGVPNNPTSGKYAAGAVVVIPGSIAGLDSAKHSIWSRDTPGITSTAGDVVNGYAESFGSSLGAGDFDGDGRADLAIGVTDNSGGKGGAGGFHVIYGSKKGLSAKGDRFFNQDTKKVMDQSEAQDFFGLMLRGGELNGDRFDDLVVGAPSELMSGGQAHGALAIFFGSKKGLTAKKNRIHGAHEFGQDADAVLGGPLGDALEIADFDRDGTSELVVGVPQFDQASGHVAIVSSAKKKKLKKLEFASMTFLDQSVDPAEPVESFDLFGSATAVGDFDGDGFPDLAIGSPLEADGAIQEVGLVQVARGGANGFVAPGATFSQATPGMPDETDNMNDAIDHFGAALSAGDFNGDGKSDLVIGVPNQLTPIVGSPLPAHALYGGSIVVLYGSASGLTTQGASVFIEPSGAWEHYHFGAVMSH